MSLQAVVYDMDGLMVDSEPLWHLAEMEVFREVGVELTDKDCLMTTGLRHNEVVGFWYDKKGPWGDGQSKEDACTPVASRLIENMVSRLRTQLAAKPGLFQSMDFFSSKGLPLAVASSSPMVLITAALEGLSVRDRFDVVCSAEHEDLGKPHPAVYLSACEKLGVDPSCCLALEDSMRGVLAAKSAQMMCVAVPEQFDDLRGVRARQFGVADMVLESLVDMDEKRWQVLTSKAGQGQGKVQDTHAYLLDTWRLAGK